MTIASFVSPITLNYGYQAHADGLAGRGTQDTDMP
jgi:hypothetical protein